MFSKFSLWFWGIRFRVTRKSSLSVLIIYIFFIFWFFLQAFYLSNMFPKSRIEYITHQLPSVICAASKQHTYGIHTDESAAQVSHIYHCACSIEKKTSISWELHHNVANAFRQLLRFAIEAWSLSPHFRILTNFSLIS